MMDWWRENQFGAQVFQFYQPQQTKQKEKNILKNAVHITMIVYIRM